ncbi:MAG: DUF1631 family protein [Gammaproteobacteria bacterium]|nr:DUF1631 family protein [Gammaproteobacteria bacterium]
MVDNQRAYPRYAVAVDIAVTVNGGETAFCSIKDFCIGGIYFDGCSIIDSPSGKAQLGTTLKIEFDAPNGTFQFDGEIVRITSAGVGVRFTHRNIAALKYLQELSAEQGALAGEDGGVMLRQPNSDVADACSRIIYTFVAWLIEEYLKRLSENIFDASSTAANNEDQGTLFHAFKELKRFEGDIHDHFMEMMEQQLSLYTAAEFKNAYKIHEADGGGGGLSLVDKGEFDNWLSITALISSMETRYHQEFFEIEKRLDSISVNPVNRENNPAAPFAIGHIFFDAIDGKFEESLVNEIVYQSYEKIFRVHYPELISQLNSLFKSESILEDLEQEYEVVKLGEDGEPVEELEPEEPEELEPEEDELEIPAAPQQSVAPSSRQPVSSPSSPRGAFSAPSSPSGGAASQPRQPASYFSGNSGDIAAPQYQPGGGASQQRQPAPYFDGDSGEIAAPQYQPEGAASQLRQPGPFFNGNSGEIAAPIAQSVGRSSTQSAQFGSSEQGGQSRFESEQFNLRGGGGSYGSLRDLLTSARVARGRTIARGGAGVTGATTSGQRFSSQDVMQELSRFAPAGGLEGLREEGVDVAEYLTSQLQQKSPENRDMVLASSEGEALGMMGQFLGTMQFDRLMNRIVKQWLQRLEIPLLKAMVNDPELLGQDDSPAQQLFEHLDNLGEIVPEMPPEASRDVRAKVDKLIERVTDEVETNTNVIPETVAAIGEIHQHELKGYNKNRERAIELGKKEYEVIEARQVVLTELNKLIGGREVPEVLLELLDAGWKNLLLSTYMREGSDSTVFKTYIGIIEQLKRLLSITNVYNDTEAKTGQKTHEWIDRMLSISAQDKDKSKAVTKQLKELLDKEGAESRAAVKMKRVPVLTAETFSGMADDGQYKPAKLSDEEWQRWLVKGQNISLKDAAIYKDEEGATSKVSLAWIDDDHTHFIFIDRSGTKQLSLSIGELAKRLYNQSLEIFDGGALPVVERTSQVIMEDTHEKIVNYAKTDELTGLLGRREFILEIERVLLQAKREKTVHVLCYLDLDRFTVINSTCGHEAGDQLLKDVAEIFTSTCEGNVIISHLNGDEFGFIFEDCSRVAGLQKAKKIQQALRNFIFECDDNEFSITASIGAVEISKDSESQSKLLSAVDSACFAAKDAGRDRIQLSHTDNKALKARQNAMAWVGQIKSYFDKGLVQLKCQKIEPLNPESGLKPHYEVLLRVNDASGEPVALEEFIAAAEFYNRITDIDQWVAGTALDWVEENQGKVSHIDGLSINISGNSMSDKLFMDYLYDRLTSGHFDPRFINFEVTETSAIDDLDYAIFFINKLKTTGCHFSLDDFGTGLSSYAYLRKLPVDYLKIDGVFVKNIDTNEDDLAVVRSITEIGHIMGKKIIAEFIANENVLAKIKETSVEFGQGYAIEKPIDLDQLLIN